tara:strand:+ start:291 stop:491 length:201 start_codon:yes stop_codon:yes gene_type:complete
MNENRFKNGASVGLAPVPIYQNPHLLDASHEHTQRGSDDRHIIKEGRRQAQMINENVRLIHDRPYQ